MVVFQRFSKIYGRNHVSCSQARKRKDLVKKKKKINTANEKPTQNLDQHRLDY